MPNTVIRASALVGVLCLMSLFSAGRAQEAGFNPPTGFHTVKSVSDIQSHCHDRDFVRMQGRLTGYLGKNRYEFTDRGDNRIEVRLDKDVDWSAVHKDQLIEIVGKVEKNMFNLNIKAKGYSLLENNQQPGDGDVVRAFSRSAEKAKQMR